jgi:type I restriction enzyme M protein
MNKSNNKLIKIIEYIQKDMGINNAIDAMEQFSLLLLLKYFYDLAPTDTNDSKGNEPFRKLFYKGYNSNYGRINPNFFTLHDVFEQTDSFYLEDNEIFTSQTLKKIEYFLTIIPFKIRSSKILEIVLRSLDDININEELADEYDMQIVSMINSSISSGAFHTPKALVSALVQVSRPENGQHIYDPAMGTGRFLVESKKLLKHGNLQFKGNDLSPFACLVGSLNLLLNGIKIDGISLEDSFLFEDNSQYDLIFSGIPFGKPSDTSKYEDAYYGYTSSLEAMFLKHTMQKLAPGGKALLIVPDSLLFNRTKELEKLRHQLLTQFNLHSILSLPNGTLAPYSGVKVSVLFFDNTKSENYIWFYELRSTKHLNKTNQISDSDLVCFIELFPTRAESENSCLVSKQDILNDEHLNLSLELPNKADVVNDFHVSDEIMLLQEKKKEYDLLFSTFTSLLEDSKRASYVNKVYLGELLTTKSGTILNTKEIKEEGRYPVYGGNGIIGYFHECNRVGDNIIIGRVGANCGNIHFSKGPMWLTNNSFSVEIKPKSNVHLPYLAHVLRSLNLNKLGRGSAQPSISYSKIKDIEISLPTYEHQVELSGWFEKIETQSNNLSELLKLQADKFSELSNYSIVSNCIDKDHY